MAYNVPFPTSSSPGLRPGEGGGRLLNTYAEKDGEQVVFRRSAGLITFAATGKSGPRGMAEVNGNIFMAYQDGSVVAVNATYATASVLSGVIYGAAGVTWARNNKVTGGASTPDILAVSETGGAYVVTTTNVTAYADTDLPATVNSVAFLDGFFIFTVPDGRIFASELNSTEVNALSFTTAEAQPDGLLRGIAHGGLYYAMGPSSIEPYRNIGSSPFSLQRSTSIIPVGIKTTMAVAGYELGWDRDPYFVANDGTVRRLSGYEAQTVSTPAVESFIARSTVSSLEASVYVARGKAFWVLSSDQGTWELNVNTGEWTERQSAGLTRWRGSRSVKSGDRWIVGDRIGSSLLAISETVTTEAGSAVTWTAESGPVKDFAGRIETISSYADFTAADAALTVSWSHNGGQSWANPLSRSLAKADRFPISVHRHGLTTHHGMRLRYSSAATADFSFLGAMVQADPRAP